MFRYLAKMFLDDVERIQAEGMDHESYVLDIVVFYSRYCLDNPADMLRYKVACWAAKKLNL